MSFKDIKGQNKAIDILKAYISSSSVKGAYLFTGPQGVGKYLATKTFAKTLNCLDKEDDSCDRCLSCLKIDKGQHPDFHLIDSEDSDAIKIEYIRKLKEDISLKPYEARKKVFVINDAHNLTSEAANALLKILEEPPKDSLIILISSKPSLLFETIISRCKTIRFYPLMRQELKGHLKKDYGLDDALSHFLAYFSEGRIGLALRLKDKDILREKNSAIDELGVLKRTSPAGLQKYDKQEFKAKLNVLASWFRDIYLLKAGIPDSDVINLDRKTELLRLMNRYSFFDLEEIIRFISDSLLYLEQNVNSKLLIANLKEAINYGGRSAGKDNFS